MVESAQVERGEWVDIVLFRLALCLGSLHSTLLRSRGSTRLILSSLIARHRSGQKLALRIVVGRRLRPSARTFALVLRTELRRLACGA